MIAAVKGIFCGGRRCGKRSKRSPPNSAPMAHPVTDSPLMIGQARADVVCHLTTKEHVRRDDEDIRDERHDRRQQRGAVMALEGTRKVTRRRIAHRAC